MEVNVLKRQLDDDNQPRESPLNLKGTQFLPTPTPTLGSTSSKTTSDQRASPAPSESELSSIQDVSSIAASEGAPNQQMGSTATAARPAKRRKLTPAEILEKENEKVAKAREKEARRQERDAKKVEQAELKAKKDEEKHVKDVERQKKAEEREAKRREKELEEERKLQDKLKKERSQMRLGAFFQQPATSNVEPATPPTIVKARRRSLSLETYDAAQDRKPVVDSCAEQPVCSNATAQSEYSRYFLPFELRPHTSLYISIHSGNTDVDEQQQRFDAETKPESLGERCDLGLQPSYPALRASFPKGLRGRSRPWTVKKLHQATSITDKATATATTDPIAKLSGIPVRYIHFQEDIRPPYFGTFTSIQTEVAAKSARSNPFARCRKDTNYDYDSEVEWDDHDPDGEDLDNDDDDDESVDDGQEMDEFLDDENDELATRRKVTVSDLVPQYTGICWQNTRGKYTANEVTSPDAHLLASLQLQVLLPGLAHTSIDPFSTSYWQISKPAECVNEASKEELASRPPLAERSSNTPCGAAETAWPIQSKDVTSAKRGPKAGLQKSMSADEFEEFKADVAGSLLGKQELLLKLKSSFPKLTSVLIKDTLGEKFAQVGKSKADKKWVFVGST